MSAPVISLIDTTDSPNDGRAKINSSLTSLRSGTVWLDPASPQSGVAIITGAVLSSFVSVGAAPAAAGAVRLENTAEIRWAYSGGDFYRMRNDGAAWDLSFYGSGAWHPVIYTVAGVVQFPSLVSLSSYMVTAEIAAPGNPASGYGAIYAKNDGKLYYKNSGGTEYDMTAGAGAAVYSRGSGLPAIGTVPEGHIRYDETAKTLNISVNGVWITI